MARTVVHPQPGTKEPSDNYGDKLAKYVPAEVIAFYLLAYAGLGTTVALQATVFIAGALGTVVYLLIRADSSRPPRAWYYLLSVVSFGCWALSTSTVGADLFGWGEAVNTAAVVLGVFLIPAIDELILKFFPGTIVPVEFECPAIPYTKPSTIDELCALIDCWATEWRNWGKNVQADLIALSARIDQTRAECSDISGGSGPGTGTGPPPDPPFGGGPT